MNLISLLSIPLIVISSPRAACVKRIGTVHSKLEPFLQGVADDAKLDASEVMKINLALEEAVTNIIHYAYPSGERGFIGLDADVSEEEICFTLIDGGLQFDPTVKPDPDVTLGVEDRPIGGLGIFMVRKIMDEVRYERVDAKNILTMIKKR